MHTESEEIHPQTIPTTLDPTKSELVLELELSIAVDSHASEEILEWELYPPILEPITPDTCVAPQLEIQYGSRPKRTAQAPARLSDYVVDSEEPPLVERMDSCIEGNHKTWLNSLYPLLPAHQNHSPDGTKQALLLLHSFIAKHQQCKKLR